MKDFKYEPHSKSGSKNQLNSIALNRKFLRILRAQFGRLCPGTSILNPITYSTLSHTHNHLFNIKKYKKTDVQTFIASKKYCPDLVLQYSVRTHKILKCYKLDCLQQHAEANSSNTDHDLALNPIAPKSVLAISQAFTKAPVYNFETKQLEHKGSKTETLHMCLKTFGFADIGGARRTGKSLIYIWKDNSDPELKNKTKLNLKSSKHGRTA